MPVEWLRKRILETTPFVDPFYGGDYNPTSSMDLRYVVAKMLVNRYKNGLAIVPVLAALYRLDLFKNLNKGKTVRSIAKAAGIAHSGRTGWLTCALHLVSMHGWLVESKKKTLRFAAAPGTAYLQRILSNNEDTIEATLNIFESLTASPPVAVGGLPMAESVCEMLMPSVKVAMAPLICEAFDRDEAEIVLLVRDYLDGLLLSAAYPMRVAEGASQTHGGNDGGYGAVIADEIFSQWLARPRSDIILDQVTVDFILGAMPTSCTTLSYSSYFRNISELLRGETPKGSLVINRALNLVGSAYNSRSILSEMCEDIIAPVFNSVPLHAQPAGIADIGCGNGEPLLEVAKFIVEHTVRGQNLQKYPLSIYGIDICPISCSSARERFDSELERIGITRHAVLQGDVSSPQAIKLALNSFGCVHDLLYLMMFVAHQRKIEFKSPSRAIKFLRFRVDRVMKSTVYEVLRRHFRWPELARLDANRLLNTVLASFDAVGQSDGHVVPAIVLCADYVRFLEEWKESATHGFVLTDLHVPVLADLFPHCNFGAGAVLRAANSNCFAPWGSHFVSGQLPLSFPDHLLCCALAGIDPDGRIQGSGRIPAALTASSRSSLLEQTLGVASYSTAHYRYFVQ